MAADSLVARHRAMPEGGWAWRSSIQAPHHQTDRDVGAASIGEGLLAAYAVTGDARYKRAAVAAGDFLLGVAEPASGGLRWPDWADPDGERSTTHFTSFDDGAAGISDFLWRLYKVTGSGASARRRSPGMRWLVAQAEGPSCPETACSWTWTDDPSWRVAYHGVGMGQAGIVLALDAFADRTGDPDFRAYARAGALRLRLLTENGARPLPRGSEDATLETGFLAGSAGAAYMFLRRYAQDRDPADLATARGLLRWVNAQALADGSGGLHWPISRGSAAMPAGFELGAAGIAWVNLRAHRATGEREYRRDRSPGGRLAQVRRDPWIGMGRAARRRDRPGPRRARQRRGRDRLGARGPRARGHRTGREQGGRTFRSGGHPRRRRSRPPRGVLVREPDGDAPAAARRALVALGIGRDRRLRRSARRLVRPRPRWAARSERVGSRRPAAGMNGGRREQRE